MVRYQIIFAYDGTNFTGSQRQSNSRTIQGELEKALRQLGWRDRSILLSGRTDTGVHAEGQVAAFDLEWSHTVDDLRNSLNSNLPLDMAVKGVKIVPDDFHPRFHATARRYCYRLFCKPVRDPLRERYAWRIWPPITNLVPIANIWPGQHDFTAFGSPQRPGGSTVRNVMFAEWRSQDDEWTFEIKADAFLYRMVRRITFAQVAVGQNKIPLELLIRALAIKPEDTSSLSYLNIPAGLAPARGLKLVEVEYANLV